MDAIITRQWTELIVKGDQWKSVLVIETSLETNPAASGFDKVAIEEMLMRDIEGLSDSEHDHVRIIPKGVRQ